MDLNEIKKTLYKEKPIAILSFTHEEYVQYIAKIGQRIDVVFQIPIEEHQFEKQVPAQLLIRWISIK